MAAILRSVQSIINGTGAWLFFWENDRFHLDSGVDEEINAPTPRMGMDRRALRKDRRRVERGMDRTLQSRIGADC